MTFRVPNSFVLLWELRSCFLMQTINNFTFPRSLFSFVATFSYSILGRAIVVCGRSLEGGRETVTLCHATNPGGQLMKLGTS